MRVECHDAIVLNRHREDLTSAALDAHDRQKNFPAEFWDELVVQMRDRLPNSPTVLDAGVGSGLVAHRLATIGLSVIGVDFNSSMLDALRRRTREIAVVMGDVTVLPVRSASVDGVVMINVLHLLDDWPLAVREAARTLRTGGALVVGLGSSETPGPGSEFSRFFLSQVPSDGAARRTGPQSIGELEDVLEREGMAIESPIEVSGAVYRTIREVVHRLQHNVFTWPANTPQLALDDAAERTLALAAEQGRAIDDGYSTILTMRLHVGRRR